MQFHVADLIERIAGHVPERDAIVCGERRLSYREFERSADGFARHLLSVGLTKGDHVAIYGYNSIEWLIAMLGCYKIGAVPININYRYVEDELRHVFGDADVRAVVYDAEFSPRLQAIREQLPLVCSYVHIDWPDRVPVSQVEGSISFGEACACRAGLRFPERSAEDHYVLYTGGTTGMPKGVVWRQEDVVMTLGGGIDINTQEPLPSPEVMADRCVAPTAYVLRSLQMAPLMHGAAQWGVLRALFEGWTAILPAARSFDAHEIWRLVEREQVNVILVTGDAMAKPLMEALETGKPEGGDYVTSSLFALASTSAVFSPSLKDRFVEKLSNIVLTDNIGSSESGFTGSSVHARHGAETNAGGPRVQPARDVVVMDEQHQQIAAGDSRIGLLAKSGRIPIAYYKDPEKTARTFITAADGKRYVIPGDMARHNADGSITLLGRGSHCINSGGEKIFPEEVEAAIKAHDDVIDCLVVATPDARFGSCVTALIQLREGASLPTMDAVHEACKTHISRYKLPRRIYYVAQVARLPSGKADYRWAQQEAQCRYEQDMAAGGNA